LPDAPVLDEHNLARATRQRLQPHRTGSCKNIKNSRSDKHISVGQHRKEAFPHLVGRGSQSGGLVALSDV
jgi:hypothetical protein